MTQHGGEAGGETEERRHGDGEKEDKEVLASEGNGGGRDVRDVAIPDSTVDTVII